MSDDLVKRLRSPRNIFYEYAVDDGAFLREAADRIEALEAELLETQDRANAFATKEYHTEIRAKRAEAKLAKAVEVAEKSIKWLRLYGADVHREAATLAELTGKTDD